MGDRLVISPGLIQVEILRPDWSGFKIRARMIKPT
jgi:hypothetical protein